MPELRYLSKRTIQSMQRFAIQKQCKDIPSLPGHTPGEDQPSRGVVSQVSANPGGVFHIES